MSPIARPYRDPTQPKVVHVAVAGDIGGAERFLLDPESRLDRSSADHSIALMTPNPALRECSPKWIDLAITAMTKIPFARLVNMGDGSSHRSMERMVRRAKLCDPGCFAGYQPDPRALVAMSHAAVDNCAIEGGLATLEARAMGRPVVAFNAGGAAEIVWHGEMGWLAAEILADGLAQRMAEASMDHAPAKGFGLRARHFVERECNVNSMRFDYGRPYQKVLGHVGPRLENSNA